MKLKTLLMKCNWYARRRGVVGVVLLAGLACLDGFAATAKPAVKCLADGQGYFRARITGAIDSELNWGNEGMECDGGLRPSGGARMRFSHPFGKPGQKLTFVFGMPTLVEGKSGRNLPVNLTVIREGAGQFFGTAGEDKCSLDELRQTAIVGPPRRNRSYHVIVRGFCIQPAPAVTGKGFVLLTRFDFSGRIDFTEEDAEPAELIPNEGGQ